MKDLSVSWRDKQVVVAFGMPELLTLYEQNENELSSGTAPINN